MAFWGRGIPGSGNSEPKHTVPIQGADRRRVRSGGRGARDEPKEKQRLIPCGPLGSSESSSVHAGVSGEGSEQRSGILGARDVFTGSLWQLSTE